MSDVLIKKQGAIAAVMDEFKKSPTIAIRAKTRLENLSPVQSESTRIFVELVVKHPDPRVCTYKEYIGKPYYSIKYIENGETHVGYGTYSLDVLSQYLKDYFMPSMHSVRKEGEWIKNDNGTYSCSICHSWIPEEQHYYARYCLHCGVVMKERRDE